MSNFLKFFLKKRSRMFSITLLLFLIILHHLSIGWMRESRVIEHLMVALETCGLETVAAVMGFIFLRIFVVVCIPGFVLGMIAVEIWKFVEKSRIIDSVDGGENDLS